MTAQELNVRDKQEVTNQEHTRPGRSYLPDVDIYETPDRLVLVADMPGVDEKSINVHLGDGMLTIEGQVAVKEYENLTPVYTEYNVGNYVRRFTVSRDVDAERISARMVNGVLEVDLPKAEHTKPRRINVSTH